MDKDEKRASPLRRIVAFLATVALILVALYAVTNWQSLNFDFIRRWWNYRSLSRNESGQVEAFAYDGGVNNTFAQVGDDFFVVTGSGVRLYSAASGAAYVEQTCAMSHPILSTGGNTALVYDLGGNPLYVYRDRALAFTYTPPSGNSILAASLSAQGRLTVATQASGVKGAVTVYDSNFQPVFGVNLSSRFITDAILSPDGATLALATAGQTGGAYDGQIAFYSLARDSEKKGPDAVYDLGSNAVLKLDWSDQQLRVLGETALVYVNADGTEAGSYSYGFRYLKGYALEGETGCALLLGKYRAGTEADLVTVDPTGNETASLSMDQQVLSLSCAGRYLSVLTADGLTIYNSGLEPYHVQTELQNVRQVLQRPDGSALLISDDWARLYLPD